MIEEDDEDTGPVRLWPAILALAAAIVLAVATTILVLSARDGDVDAGPEEVMRVVLVAPVRGGTVRLVTFEGGCRVATRATADLRADAVAFTVLGRDPGGGCTAGEKLRCSEVVLPQSVGRRRVLPDPVAEYRSEAGRHVTEPCPRIPVEA